MTDADHAAVYAAEVAAFDGTDLEEVRPFASIDALLRRVIDSAWWPGGSVDVLRARADAVSSTTRCGMADQGNDGRGRGDRSEGPGNGRDAGERGGGDGGAGDRGAGDGGAGDGGAGDRGAGDHGDHGGHAAIRLAASQMTVATAAHELAHALAGTGHGHDAVYRRAYLDVVRVITNVDSTDRRRDLHVDQLSVAFGAAGLAVGERSWAAPTDGTGSAIAL